MDKRCLVWVGKKSQNPNAQVLGFGNLSIEVTGNDTPFIDTNTIYTITVTNNPPAAIPAVVEFDVPANATFVSASNSWTYDSETRKVTRPSQNISPSGTFIPTVTVTFQNEEVYSLNWDVLTTAVQPADADNDDTLSIEAFPLPPAWTDIYITDSRFTGSIWPNTVTAFTKWATDLIPFFTEDIVFQSWNRWKLWSVDLPNVNDEVWILTTSSVWWWIEYKSAAIYNTLPAWTWAAYSWRSNDPIELERQVTLFTCPDEFANNYDPTANPGIDNNFLSCTY